MDQNVVLKVQRDYAWAYFQLHANQRMSSFNFFVVIAALLSTGLAGTFHKDFEYYYVGVFIGAALILIAFIFWKLDQRVRLIIKHAEKALMEIERESNKINLTNSPSSIPLFSLEEKITEGVVSQQSWLPWKWHLSYSDCFGLVFLVFGSLGLLAVIANIFRLID